MLDKTINQVLSSAEQGEPNPMTARKLAAEAKSARLKRKKTGLKESFCEDCKQNLPISKFTIYKTGGKSRRAGGTIKPRKNAPEKEWQPRKTCNKCLQERDIASGKYERGKKGKRDAYKNNRGGCRKVYAKAAKRARKLLADSYIKRLLKADGYTDKDISPALIKEKRAKVKAKRKSAANQTYLKKRASGEYARQARKTQSDWYVRSLIKAQKGYNGESISWQTIIDKRDLITDIRRGIISRGYASQKTSEEKKETYDRKIQRFIGELSDGYVTRCIKCSVKYKGEEITPKMIEAKRQEILIRRKKQESGRREPKGHQKLTDSYVRKVYSLRMKIPTSQITNDQVIIERERLMQRRDEKAKRESRSANMSSI